MTVSLNRLRSVRMSLAGFLLVVFLSEPSVAQTAEGNESNFQIWVVALGAVAIASCYAFGLRWLRRRASTKTTRARPTQGTFSDAELDRYARHIMLREIGGEGQRRLKQAKVAVVGAGGLGSPALLYLAAAGVGKLTVIDDDVVEISNLQRQIIHTDQSIDLKKTDSANRAIRAINPYVEVINFTERLTFQNSEILTLHDLVLDGSDNFDTRNLVNRVCADSGVPLVSGAISQWEGQVTVADPARGYPCLSCLFPVQPDRDSALTCAEAGVMGALPGIIGTIMASEAIKMIVGAGQPLRGRLLIFDALWGDFRVVKYPQNSACKVCGVARKHADE